MKTHPVHEIERQPRGPIIFTDYSIQNCGQVTGNITVSGTDQGMLLSGVIFQDTSPQCGWKICLRGQSLHVLSRRTSYM